MKNEWIEMVEKNCLNHFIYLPLKLGYEIKYIHGVAIVFCGLGTSMFNIAYGSDDITNENRVNDILSEFHGQPFAWWIPPTEKNIFLTDTLHKMGFTQEAIEYAMICDLNNYKKSNRSTELDIKQVDNKTTLNDFIHVLEIYDISARTFYEKLTPDLLQHQEKLFVGYFQHQPTTIGILHTHNGKAAIFGLLTNENLRGRGFGRAMTDHLINQAISNHITHVTLSASSDNAFRMYERLGFKVIDKFECFEWAQCHPTV